jgi:hypothetical protein
MTVIKNLGRHTTFHESSPSSKPLQAQQSTIWWVNTCPWHGFTTILRVHSSTMLGACLLQFHGAIYNRNPISGMWLSDDTLTTWSRGLANMCVIKGDEFISCLATSFVTSASMMPEPAAESHGYSTPSIRGQFVAFWAARESPTTVDQ